MTTYYVSPTGSNTSPYDTWAKAANLPSSAITAGDAVAETHTMYIAPGTYADSLALTNANWAGGTLIGTSAHGVTTAAAKGQVIINKASGSIVCNITKSVTIQNITFTGSDTDYNVLTLGSSTLIWLDNVWAYGPARRVASISNTSFLITNSRLEGCAFYDGVLIEGTSAGNIENTIFDQSITSYFGGTANYGIQFNQSGNVFLKHCWVDGAQYCTIGQTGTGKTYIYNSFIGAPTQIDNYYSIYRSAGEIHLFNSLLMEPFASSLKLSSGTLATDSNNIKISQPFITKRKRTGIIVLCVDDSENTAYVQSLEATFSSHGVKGTFFVENGWWFSNLPALRSIYNNGTFEIGCHSHSHADLSLTGDTFSITKAEATIDVDRDTNTITVDPGGTVTGFKEKTFGAIKTELTALGCTCGDYETGLNLETHGESFADSSGAQASPYTPQLLIDTTCDTGFFKTEIAYAKELLDSQFGFSSKSFSTPGGASSDDLQTAIKNAGFWGCRSASDEADAEKLLVSIDLIELSTWNVSTYITYSSATDAQVATRTRAICENAAKSGSIVYLLAHDATECTAAQWAIILDTLAEYSSDDIKVMSSYDALYYIKNSGLWSTSDQRTYARTWTDSTDYHSTSDSPCINGGVEVNITSDYEDSTRPQGYAPDIGVYEAVGGINFA